MAELIASLALVVAIIGLPFTWWIARRSRQRPGVRHAIDFHTLITPSSGLLKEGLTLDFNGTTVTRVSWTAVALWHDRGDAVDRSGVLPSDPLRLQFAEGDKPLRARIISTYRRQANFTLTLTADAVLIDFELLDTGDGLVVEILHQGDRPPTLLGTLKGATLTGPVKTDLSPATLQRLAHAHLRDRLRARVVTAMGPAPRVFLVLVAMMTAAIATLSVVWLAQQLRTPHLLSPKQYDLTSLAGQRAFADDQRSAESLGSGQVWLVPAFLVFYSLTLAIAGRGSPVPKSILKTPAGGAWPASD
jgi:hypothetical protein